MGTQSVFASEGLDGPFEHVPDGLDVWVEGGFHVGDALLAVDGGVAMLL